MHAVLSFAGTLAALFVRTMPRISRVVPFLLIPLAAALSACSSPAPSFRDDQLLSNAPSPFSHGFNYASTDACEAARRALLSQGYMTTMTRNDTVDATKNFQPSVDQHIAVEVHVVCTPSDATNTSMLYVNAVQNGYALKKSATSASVGLSILGSVSLPIHSNSDEMVKVSSETVQSTEFYKRFFDLVGRYLGGIARSEPVPGGDIKAMPLQLEPNPAMVNAAAPGASTAPAAAAAAAAAAVTGATVLHASTVPSSTNAISVQAATHAAAPVAAASGVHAVFPASPASEATLLTPVLPVAASAAAATGTAAVPASAASSAALASATPAHTAAQPATASAAAAPAPASGAQSATAASSVTANATSAPISASAPTAAKAP
ncbi:hypothetical protein LMG28688_03292 [Paraburkholderia caffeinitolerans]|uniref:DUF2242 domain-containing protein n=1 Tax=Paraburkholderia caffeinitolerans TaxID=1723730 RepID=A0A6J5G153_9BURK|nr:DUF2242 domain-containing protein [Paraburkholderia caffeinitolerans]CAB3791297.1 hypothetical protein LMG28688_03292 [Paraburkholderia caffeinitolerans]